MSDLISRQAAIDAFMTMTSDGDKADWCKWVLKQLPSAQLEGCPFYVRNKHDRGDDSLCRLFHSEIKYLAIETRQVGEWINDNCSVCGQYVYHGDARNYCPNCGAKMEVDHET